MGRTFELELGVDGMFGMKVGGKRVFTIPPMSAFGNDAPMFAEVELIEVKPGKPD